MHRGVRTVYTLAWAFLNATIYNNLYSRSSETVKRGNEGEHNFLIENHDVEITLNLKIKTIVTATAFYRDIQVLYDHTIIDAK